MPIVVLIRVLFALVSLALIALGIDLLWIWNEGHWVPGPDGAMIRLREDWQLWTGVGLLLWSLLGRSVTRLLLAKSDTDTMSLQRVEGQFIESPTGASLHAEYYGPVDGQPLILTHGWSLDSRIWFYAKRDLAKQFRVIVWDLPGLGRSRRAGSKVDIGGYAQDLAAVLASAGGKPAILVGHSIGGMIIQTLARDEPALFEAKVEKVVLFNTTYTNPLHTMILSSLAQFLRWPLIEPMMRLTILFAPVMWFISWQSYLSGSTHISARFGFGRYVTRSQLDAAAYLMTANSPAVSAHGDLAMFRWDSGMALARVDVPVLVLGGAVDIITKPEASLTLAAAIPDAQVQIIEGVNHMGPFEQAGRYHEAIIAFANEPQPPVACAEPHPLRSALSIAPAF